MNKVPIVFAFDTNLVFPACVCLSSLLMNAEPTTFYDIFILHAKEEDIKKEKFDLLTQHYKNCRIRFREVDNRFSNSFEIRGITTPAYYRLVIPELIPEYDQIIYSDVDVIFRRDLSYIYNQNIGGNYIAATYDLGLNLSEDGKQVSSLLERKQVFAGQAPESFRYGKYLEANEALLPDKILNINGSTEPAILAGMQIKMIPGDECNYKITTENDLKKFMDENR